MHTAGKLRPIIVQDKTALIVGVLANITVLSGYLDDWENISFEDKRKAADGLISSISATSDYVKIEWKI